MPARIVAFDLYGTLLDYTKLQGVVAEYSPMAEAVVDAWRARQLQLTNAATSTGRYVDFDRITLLALHEIAPRFMLKLASADQKRLVDAWAQLPLFPDVLGALDGLARRRIPCAVITNGVASTVRNALVHAGIEAYFSEVYSADAVATFKPNKRVYDQILALGVVESEVLFVSSNDWDAMGARQAGYRTVWVNRRRNSLSPRPERTISDLSELSLVLDDDLAAR